MATWQVLHAGGPLQTTRERTTHGRVGGHTVASSYGNGIPGAYAPVHYTADAAQGSVRTFHMGGGSKGTMQDLNGRLASYMDEVQALGAANATLEMQIRELLHRKSPGDLKELDRHLHVINTLHSQVMQALATEAQTKLQLVSVVLVASELSAKLDAERNQSAHLQTHLRDLRLVGEQLQTNMLPGLSHLVTSHTQELTELHAQHFQVSGEISMQLSCAESFKLSQQLEMFRDQSLNEMLDQNQAQNNSWFNTQASMLTCKEEETLHSSSSEVFQIELNKLRETRLMLEEELTKQKIMLEQSDFSFMEGYSELLAQLQQRADNLGQQLSAVLQTTSKQAEEYQALLNIKSSLEREIQDYATLLDMKQDSASGRISSAVRQSGPPGGNRAPSPGPGRKLGSSTGSAGRLSGGSGGRISSPYGGSRMSSTGSGGKHSHSGSSDRLSGGQALRISVGQERISVCKRAALSISAAGRERSQEKHRSTQRMGSANNPRIQHWVTTGVGGTAEGLDDQDDILNL
ncbi:hypothetical protein NHX12_032043 [Muraenolepis orangiensis]|uniref:IF rod domain-containing protein n=1 Tax=Muraenolepis orangiensis TaxID=630683 RepID=A0A9Q0E8Z4_9TELE|nr:hypothetical protein NHX12_032043 [Muraenolepis orangiensis]